MPLIIKAYGNTSLVKVVVYFQVNLVINCCVLKIYLEKKLLSFNKKEIFLAI